MRYAQRSSIAWHDNHGASNLALVMTVLQVWRRYPGEGRRGDRAGRLPLVLAAPKHPHARPFSRFNFIIRHSPVRPSRHPRTSRCVLETMHDTWGGFPPPPPGARASLFLCFGRSIQIDRFGISLSPHKPAAAPPTPKTQSLGATLAQIRPDRTIGSASGHVVRVTER